MPRPLAHWGYKEGDIVMLVDNASNPRQMPTKRNILDAMRWLVKDAHPHDALFFHCTLYCNHVVVTLNALMVRLDSGHGGQIPDKNGDETDGLDEGKSYPLVF
jgi:hypothetical protein